MRHDARAGGRGACGAVSRRRRLMVRYIQRCKKLANRDVRDFGWGIAHEAVSRRPPISLDTIVARTEGYTYDAKFGICPSF